MQLRQRDISGNYPEKNGGHCSHHSTHKCAIVRKVTGRVAQMRNRAACPCSPEKLSAARRAFVRDWPMHFGRSQIFPIGKSKYHRLKVEKIADRGIVS